MPSKTKEINKKNNKKEVIKKLPTTLQKRISLIKLKQKRLLRKRLIQKSSKLQLKVKK